MVAGLGTRFFVTETAIKTFSVGYPNQAPLDAMLTLRREHGLTHENVRHVLVRLPADGAAIVSNSAMPDVNCQHLIALALLKGAVSFKDSHDRALMNDPLLKEVRARVELVGDPALVDPAAPRSGFVEVTLSDGRKLNHFTRHPPGTKENPLLQDQVAAKARDLMEPVIGEERAQDLIVRLLVLEDMADVRELRPLIRA
jgi:2-methylcitrate dehydratase PrpD